jgi:hypothetical protein
MRYFFNAIDANKKILPGNPGNAVGWAAMTIPNTFQNNAPDTCRGDVQVTDVP